MQTREKPMKEPHFQKGNLTSPINGRKVMRIMQQRKKVILPKASLTKRGKYERLTDLDYSIL